MPIEQAADGKGRKLRWTRDELELMGAQVESSRSYDLETSAFFTDPESTFSEMRKSDPVYFHEGLASWVLTRYEDVSSVVRDVRFSVDRNGEIGRNGSASLAAQLESVNAIVRRWMVFSDPPRHTRLRAAVSRFFQPRALRELEPVVREIVDDLLDRTAGRSRFDVLSEFGEPLAERVTAHMLGLPPEDAPRLKAWTYDLFGLVGAAQAEDEVVRANSHSIDAFRDYVSLILNARRAKLESDLVSDLLREVGGEFTEEELVGLVITLVAGAYETTAHLISNGTYSLLQHPDQGALLRRNPRLIVGAVEELFRFCGPALGVQRRALFPVEIGGRKLATRDRVFCMLHAANHDPEIFAQPERLDIGRNPCRHLGLGLGAHFCLGAWLTRMESQVAILSIVDRLPGLRLVPERLPRWKANFAIRGLENLIVDKGDTATTVPAPSETRMRVSKS